MSNAKDKHFWDETRKPWMDLENERKPIRPQKSGKTASRANELTGISKDSICPSIRRNNEPTVGGLLPGYGYGKGDERSCEGVCPHQYS